MDDVDGIEEWTQAQRRVIDLVGDLDDEQVARTVPACPGWSVRELLAHMVGLGAEVVAGNEPDDHNEEWTQAQVDERRDASVADLVEEWRGLTEPLREWMRANGTRPLGDVTIHEQDLRGAVGVPGGKDTPAMVAMRDRFAGRVAARIRDGGPLALVGDTWTWTSSDGVDPADAAVVVRASDFELTRAVMARRSENQLRSWTERGDVGPCLDAFATLGPLPPTDLHE